MLELKWRNAVDVRHLSREGTARVRAGLPLRPQDVLWEQLGAPNIFHDGGEQYLLQVVFTEEAAVPENFYLGLDARAVIAEADDLTALSGEPTQTGYARQPVPSTNVGFTLSQDAGDWQAATTTETFTAGEDWPQVLNLFLCTVVSGTVGVLLCSLALSTGRTLQNGESLQADMTIKISE